MGKGSANERSKCRDWSLWWSKGLGIDPPRDDIFYRTGGSGARATMRLKKGKMTAGGIGDMMAVDVIGEPLMKCVTVEFKKGYNKKLSMFDLIDGRGKKHLLVDFLKKIKKEAESVMTYPLLVVHRDYKKPVIFITDTMMGNLLDYCGDFGDKQTVVKIYLDFGVYYAMSLECFFDNVDPMFFEWGAGRRNYRESEVVFECL